MSYTPRVTREEKEREEDHDHVKEYAHKLNTGVTGTGNLLNTASADDKKRVQLPNDFGKIARATTPIEEGKNDSPPAETPILDAIPGENDDHGRSKENSVNSSEKHSDPDNSKNSLATQSDTASTEENAEKPDHEFQKTINSQPDHANSAVQVETIDPSTV